MKEDLQPIPDFWKETPKPLPAEVGTNRISWNLRYENPPANSHGYDISATPGLTPTTPEGPLVLPGVYTLTLTVDGKKFIQKVTVKNDPRSPGSAADLRRQHELQMLLYVGDIQATAGMKVMTEFKAKIADLEKAKLSKGASAALNEIDDKLDDLGKVTGRRLSFSGIQGQTVTYLARMEFGDMGPSQPVHDAVTGIASDLKAIVKAWNDIQKKDVRALNEMLKKEGALTLSPAPLL